MILLALLALLLAGITVALLIWALALPRTRAVARLQSIDAYGFSGGPVAGSPPQERPGPLTGLARRLGEMLARATSRIQEDRLRNELVAAGMYSTSPRVLLGYRVIATFVFTALALSTTLVSSPILRLLLAVGVGAAAWTLPLTYVRRKASQRLSQVDLELPDLIDQLVVTLEAGVGFSNSLQIAAQRLRGPLGNELRLTLQEQRMGLSLVGGLGNMLKRANTPNMHSFVRAVTQGESLGVSIGTVMRNLAVEMRKRRRASAEERAQKAPVKMLFPLVFCIFPVLGIVLLGPAFFEIGKALSGT
jgi:tight adherence protein C